MAEVKNRPQLVHEIFCLPRPDQTEPRIESYPFYADGGAITHIITRCIECGVSVHTPRSEHG